MKIKNKRSLCVCSVIAQTDVTNDRFRFKFMQRSLGNGSPVMEAPMSIPVKGYLIIQGLEKPDRTYLITILIEGLIYKSHANNTIM